MIVDNLNIGCIFVTDNNITKINIMNIQDLKVEVKGIKKEYNDLYVSIIDFSELMISKGYSLDRVDYSSKSISTYIDYSIEFLDENGDYDCSEIITVRYSDHHANGNYGMTDVYFGSHLTLDENFQLVLEVIKERQEYFLKTIYYEH